jgi:hypothetical protein
VAAIQHRPRGAIHVLHDAVRIEQQHPAIELLEDRERRFAKRAPAELGRVRRFPVRATGSSNERTSRER